MNHLIDARFVYGEQEHQQYLQDGYHIFDHFLTDAGLADCRRHIDRMLEQLHPETAPDAIIGTHLIERWVWDLATHPRLLDMIERQIGRSPPGWGLVGVDPERWRAGSSRPMVAYRQITLRHGGTRRVGR